MCAVNGGWVGRGRGSLVGKGRSFQIFSRLEKSRTFGGEARKKNIHTRIAVETRGRRRGSRSSRLSRRNYTTFRAEISQIYRVMRRITYRLSKCQHTYIGRTAGRCDLPGRGRSSISSAQEPRSKLINDDILVSHIGIVPATYSHRPRRSQWTSSGLSASRALQPNQSVQSNFIFRCPARDQVDL